METLKESRLYREDRLGLKQMMEDDKLVFLEKKGRHLQIDDDWFIEEIVPYLTEVQVQKKVTRKSRSFFNFNLGRFRF